MSVLQAQYINDEVAKRIVVQPDNNMTRLSPFAGYLQTRLDVVPGFRSRRTSIRRLPADTEYRLDAEGRDCELFIVSGSLNNSSVSYSDGTYLRWANGDEEKLIAGTAGAVVFEMLHSFHREDTQRIQLETKKKKWSPGSVDGLRVMSLHEHGGEHVALVHWNAHTKFRGHNHWGGEEIFVLEGTFHDEHGTYPTGTWIRSPHMSYHEPFTKEDGALIYVKVGHLAE